jgi:SOS-response transcriptional repressor LexA
MNKYQKLMEQLEKTGTGKMKCFGNSMLPILETGGLLTFVKQAKYKVGDIVFCKVKGRFIDAHKITKFDPQGRAMIANNHGYENGWTKNIFGRAVQAEYPTHTKIL